MVGEHELGPSAADEILHNASGAISMWFIRMFGVICKLKTHVGNCTGLLALLKEKKMLFRNHTCCLSCLWPRVNDSLAGTFGWRSGSSIWRLEIMYNIITIFGVVSPVRLPAL